MTDVTDRLEKMIKNGNARSGSTFELQLFVKITGGVRVFLF